MDKDKEPVIGQQIGVLDVTASAAQGVQWHGQMTNAMLLPILNRLDRAGLRAIEIMDPEVFDTCVRILGEDPWERIRLAAARVTHTPLAAWIAGRFLFGRVPFAEDIVTATIHLLATNGIKRLACYDPLNDIHRLRAIIHEAQGLGLSTCGGIVFSLSPVHDDAYFLRRAQTLADFGVGAVCLLDLSGILHPDRARSLLPKLRRDIGNISLEVRIHSRSGQAERTYLEAAQLGADVLHSASAPLSSGASLPATDYLAEHLPRLGFRMGLKRAELTAIADYFAAIRETWRLPTASPQLYEPENDDHQLPASFHFELERGLERASSALKSSDVLREVGHLRPRLGYPPMTAPIAALLCKQALMNLSDAQGFHGSWEGLEDYLRGRFEAVPGPIEKDLAAQFQIHETDRAVRAPESQEDKSGVRPDKTDEDAVLMAHFTADVLQQFKCKQFAVDRSGWTIPADTPLLQLMAELDRRPWVSSVKVEKKGRVIVVHGQQPSLDLRNDVAMGVNSAGGVG